MQISKDRFIALLVLVIVAVSVSVFLSREKKGSIKIGVLYSLTGTMAISSSPIIDAINFAADEINKNGGLLGKKVEVVTADGKSDIDVFAREAERLIKDENISVLFACWTSSCRKVVIPVVEKYNHLLIYTNQYEGLEESPNTVYIGSTPNQQIFPGTKWALNHFGKKVFLVGSDYIFPNLANIMVTDLIKGFRGSVLGEVYRPLGSQDFDSVADQIKKVKPDFVINTINGDSNLYFFKALKKANLQKMPVISFSLSESELAQMGVDAAHENHFTVWNYFASLKSEENYKFIKSFKKKFGENRVVSAPIMNAYNGVYLWAHAVERIGTEDVVQVSRSIQHQSVMGPDGMHVLDIGSRHMWQKVMIGQAESNGQFKIVFSSDDLIRPEPFPFYRSRREWIRIAEAVLKKKRVL